MNLLLSTFSEVILPVIVLFVGIGVALLIFWFGKKKFKSNKDDSFRSIGSDKDISVTAVGRYVEEDEMKFLDYLHMALPQEFIAFPKVGVDQIVTPGKNRIAYNAIMSKYVDVVVFYRKTMQPVLIVDLVHKNSASETAQAMDNNIVAILKSIKLNIVQVELEPSYNIEALRHQLIHSIPDKILAEINFSVAKEVKK